MKFGILASHPVQYQAPWFRELSRQIDLEVFFAHRPTPKEQAVGFGGEFQWDIDLLSGYSYTFVPNRAARPSVDRFFGCNTPDLAAAILARGFDAFIVCGWNLRSYWQAVRVCQRNEIPVFVRGDSQLGTPRSALIRVAKKAIYPWLLRQFDGFFSVGKRNAAYLRYYGIGEDKIFFVPHFVDNSWFREKADEALPERNNLRAKLGANAETLVALFVGKFISKKNPRDLLSAVAYARRRGVAIVPVFVGTGELEPALRRYAEELGIPAVFEGFRNQTELPRYYAASDVVVLPSDGGETWGLVVNEGMACGIPAIVSDAVGCMPDLIEEGETGFAFPVGDVAILGEQLVKMFRLHQLGFNFRIALEEKLQVYSVRTAVQNTIEAITNLMSRTRNKPVVLT